MSRVKFFGKIEIIGEEDTVVEAIATLALDGDLYMAITDFDDMFDYDVREYFTFTAVVRRGNVFPTGSDETISSEDLEVRRFRLGSAAKTSVQAVGDGRNCRPFGKRLRRKAQRSVSQKILRFEREAA